MAKKEKVSTGMLIDGILGSECIDSSGEILDVEGADCTDWEAGTMLLVWEHRNEDSPGASANDMVGKIVYLKKIFSEDDCENDRQLEYWKEVECPYIYGIGRLFDKAGHPGAVALAAIIRDHHANDELITARFSVEGSTLKKLGQRLERSVVRRVAVTVKPCNRSANSGLLADPNAPEGFEREVVKEDLLEDLARAEEKLEHPSYTKLGGNKDCTLRPLQKDEGEDDLAVLARLLVTRKLLEHGLAKALEAGSTGGAAPSKLTGGAALQKEWVDLKPRAMAALRDYDGHAHDKSKFRKFCKMRMPEASDEFLDHFADRVQDFRVRKAEKFADVELLAKMSYAVVELSKAAREVREADAPEEVEFAGQRVRPGRSRHAGGEHVLLLEDKDGYVGVPAESWPDYEAEDLVRLPRLKEATHYVVGQRPRVMVGEHPYEYRHED